MILLRIMSKYFSIFQRGLSRCHTNRGQLHVGGWCLAAGAPVTMCLPKLTNRCAVIRWWCSDWTPKTPLSKAGVAKFDASGGMPRIKESGMAP